MPVVQVVTLQISCDNPDCPGNQLDPTTKEGWIFITSEVPPEQAVARVLCSTDCVAAVANQVGAQEPATEGATA